MLKPEGAQTGLSVVSVLHLFSNKKQQAAVPEEELCQETHQKEYTFH